MYRIREIAVEYKLPILALVTFVAGMFIFGWQMEIVTIWISKDIDHFEFPFYLEKLFGYQNGIYIWAARDFWYAELALSTLVGLWGAYKLGCIRIIRKIRSATKV